MSAPLPEVLPIRPFPSRSQPGATLTARVPGSKSLTNRALLLAALTPTGATKRLRGALVSRDTVLMADALRALGFRIDADGKRLALTPPARLAENARLFVGNAGTAARFLTAFLATQPNLTATLDGDAEMRARPMKGLIDALKQGGTQFEFLGRENCFPFTLRACAMRDVPEELPVDAAQSGQILSAVLLCAPFWARCARVRLEGKTVSEPFIAMTCRMMRAAWGDGVVAREGNRFAVGHAICPQGDSYDVEPDATAASYFLSLPAVSGCAVAVRGVHRSMMQGDVAYADMLVRAGFAVSEDADGLRVAPAADPRGLDADFNAISDTFLTFAALTPLLRGTTTIRGIAHTRRQETDRVAAVAAQLRKLGQTVLETPDALTIIPDRDALKRAGQNGPVRIATYRDHRMAMSFAVLGSCDVRGDGRPWLAIEDPACCGKTFPDFFDMLETLRNEADFPVVALDGGAASGKSSTARGVAEKLNFLHVDTGAHYRALTFALLGRGVSPNDAAAVEGALKTIAIGSKIEGRSSKITVDGAVPAEVDIRSERVNAEVAKFAAVPQVRAFLKAYQRGQRALAFESGFNGLIMEGRDIGTVIFPNAPYRFFLEANAQVRAARRAAEGLNDSIVARDRLDSSRKTAPLKAAEGVVRIDNSEMTLAQVIDAVARRIEEGRAA